jgi:toxin ParE1/3/4
MPQKPQLEWSRQALADLAQIVTNIADDNLQAAQDLEDEMETKVAALTNNPKLYAKSKRAAGYRQLTARANYLVFYRLLSEAKPLVIDVAPVVHARKKVALIAGSRTLSF